ncbi:kinase-like domain-containing protein [Rhizophagus clarus]|uniref:Kinase-like domain-containing protein n=1 Tax=Rhizophagus clarus TaxID=94130 RepID=A0A8H3QXA2_9GLOM|nr:kinase-like domain-containing protein [Rhizophagus clarus]
MKLELLTKNFANWTSGNEIIDNFIQEKQLKHERYSAVFEWIPYDKFIEIKGIGKSIATAIWKEGPLKYYKNDEEWIRSSYKKVTLRFLYDSENITDEFINKVESYLLEKGESSVAVWKEGPLCYDIIEKEWMKESSKKVVLKYLNSENITDEFLSEVTVLYDSYGISQNTNTKDYILVVHYKYSKKYCKECEKEYAKLDHNWCEPCRINHLNDNFINCTSGNEKIDYFIRKTQLKINNENPNVFEWIPFNELIEIKEIGDNCLTTAIWKKGPLNYNTHEKKWMRASYRKVCLKYMYYFQNITDEFIIKIELYLTNKIYYGVSQNQDMKVYILVFNNDYFDKRCEKCAIWTDGSLYYSTPNRKFKRKSNKKVLLKYLNSSRNNDDFLNKIPYLMENSYGISQDPNTKDYILVYEFGYNCENCGKKYNKFEVKNKSCMSCQTNCENEKINDLIQEMKLNIDYNFNDNIMFEWIPYDQFDDIKEIDEFINEVKAYSNQRIDKILKIYGISQNPITKDYIMCWDSNPENRPFTIDVKEEIELFYNSLDKEFKKEEQHHEIEEQFKETQESRKENLLSIKNDKSKTHTHAVYTSRLLNHFTKNLPSISTVEITDFTSI